MHFLLPTIITSILPLFANADLWMHVTVKKIERKPCAVDEPSWGAETAGCSSMSYMTLDERILPNYERRSTSFEHIDGVSRPTVTHWPKGNLADWMFSLQFISVDPVYGIARTCDRSGYLRVFQKSTQDESNQHTEEFTEQTIQVQGQCFVATVHIQASREICPWCIQESDKPTTTTTSISTFDEPLISSPPFLIITLLSLIVISFIALIGTGVLLIFYLIDRRKITESISSKPQVFELPPPMKPIKSCSTLLPVHKRTLSASTWTTKSSENWCEYPTERWSSYNPIQIESRPKAVVVEIPRETEVYQEMDTEEYCFSSDSGRDSL